MNTSETLDLPATVNGRPRIEVAVSVDGEVRLDVISCHYRIAAVVAEELARMDAGYPTLATDTTPGTEGTR